MALPGDLNGDGHDDLVVGAPGADHGAANNGAALVFFGPIGAGISVASADAVLMGSGGGDEAGVAVDRAGDVDGDGLDDLLVGAWFAAGDTGAAYLIRGGTVGGVTDLDSVAAARVHGEAPYDMAGTSVAGLGDLDGDGYDDFVVGADRYDPGLQNAGGAFVFYGPVSGDHRLLDADAALLGEDKGDHLGDSVASAGDLDGDGSPDLVVGAYKEDGGDHGSGSAYVLHGPVSGLYGVADVDATLVGEGYETWAGQGQGLARAGDVNGDGYDDLLVGAWGENQGGESSGAVYLVLGPVTDLSLADASARFIGESARDHAGVATRAVGDVNGDGYDDIAVGSPFSAPNGTPVGAAYVFLGCDVGS